MSDLTRSEYVNECRECAKEVLRECREDRQRDEYEVLLEMIDGHEYVIYTAKAQLVIAYSAHDNAYEEEFGERAPTDEARACVAMMADVREYMDAYRTGEDDTTEESNQ